uniref:Uncharacterized protein n=1 Tax=Arundo donax TaxID=35708 RepID=A0A0A9BDF7_ARUDO
MCVNFIALNKAYPKDNFPLEKINCLVNSTSMCEMMSFLDAYSDYHQVWMAEEDEEKTAFITPQGTSIMLECLSALKTPGLHS